MVKKINLSDLVDTVGGKIVGTPKVTEIAGTCSIDHYIKNRVSFIRDKKYEEKLSGSREAIVLIPEELEWISDKYPQNCYIIVDDVMNALVDVQDFFYAEELVKVGIEDTARIDSTTVVGEDVYLGNNVCIGKGVTIEDGVKIFNNSVISDNVVIGQSTVVYPNVSIYKCSEIGRKCIINSGVSIGMEGFRFDQKSDQKSVRKLVHVGNVRIEDRVEVGANSTIDKSTFEGTSTILKEDVKIDNLVHIAHNVEVRARTIIAAQTCISGSVKIGEDVFIGAGVTVSEGVNIGDGAKLLVNAVVIKDVRPGELVSGFYAMPHKRWKSVCDKLEREG